MRKTLSLVTLIIALYCLWIVWGYASHWHVAGASSFMLPRIIIVITGLIGACLLWFDKSWGYFSCLLMWIVVIVTVSNFSLGGLFNGGLTAMTTLLSVVMIILLLLNYHTHRVTS